MTVNAVKKKYPYSKNRVYLSIAITIMSLLLTLMLVQMLFQSYPTLVFSYLLYLLLSTLVITIATFLLKMRLYPFITESPSTKEQPQTQTIKFTWKMLLLVFCMLVTPIIVPLLLAGILGGTAWFILMTSFILGVSISEIIFYLYTR